MKSETCFLNMALGLLALFTLDSRLSTAQAQGTAFTYQGQLSSGTNAANGQFDLTFELFNAATGGSRVGSILTNLDVGVTNGLFTVTADFGAVYNGTAYWLQLGVRSNGTSTFTALSPRQELTPAPYSITAQNVTGAIPLVQLPAGLVTNNESGVTLSNVTVQGALTLPNPATIDSGGSSLLFDDGNNNFYAGLGAGILGGTGGANTGLGNGSLNNNVNGTNNTAVGYQALSNNTNGSYNVAIGERTLLQNTGGNDNTAEGRHALQNNTTGGDNTANGYNALLNNNTGSYNVAEGSSALSSVQSGSNNIALGYGAGININGNSNIDIGHPGVSSDNLVVRIGSGQTATYLSGTVYATSFNPTSDRNAKENFQPVDSQAVLAKVASLSVSQWNFKQESKEVQHIGPMAQDFQATFQLGQDDKHISLVDEGGVALAAIQGLNQKVENLKSENATLQEQNAKLQKHDVVLEKRLQALEKMVQSLANR